MSLPSVTVTFLFTDIEGSNRLWERRVKRATRLPGACEAARRAVGFVLPPEQAIAHALAEPCEV